MSLKQQLALDHANVFFNVDEFAEEIIYAGNVVVAVIDRLQYPEITNGAGDMAQIHVLANQVASPQIHDIVQFDNKAWVVKNIQKSDSLVFTLLCHTNEGINV